ncbi:MAG: TRAP transporter large permease subunit, partial [Chthoniobacterales bacterium]
VMTNDVLVAIPLFVFMGVMLERSRIAEDLLETMGRLFGAFHGGLAISVTLVGVLLAAAKGVVGATTVTMGLITLPIMIRHRYSPSLAAGTVAATATLAEIALASLPPSIVRSVVAIRPGLGGIGPLLGQSGGAFMGRQSRSFRGVGFVHWMSG